MYIREWICFNVIRSGVALLGSRCYWWTLLVSPCVLLRHLSVIHITLSRQYTLLSRWAVLDGTCTSESTRHRFSHSTSRVSVCYPIQLFTTTLITVHLTIWLFTRFLTSIYTGPLRPFNSYLQIASTSILLSFAMGFTSRNWYPFLMIQPRHIRLIRHV
jgi:hypothetical protein